MNREELLKTNNSNAKIVAQFLTKYAIENNWTAVEDKQKTIDECWKYIVDEARKKAVSGCAAIEDSEVYNWAVHFYDETGKAVSEPKNASQKVMKKERPKPKKAEKKSDEYEQFSLF